MGFWPFHILAEPRLTWAPSIDAVKGYRIYYGMEFGKYPRREDVGKVIGFPLSDLIIEKGKNYIFVVRAYDGNRESDNSNAVSWPEQSLRRNWIRYSNRPFCCRRQVNTAI